MNLILGLSFIALSCLAFFLIKFISKKARFTGTLPFNIGAGIIGGIGTIMVSTASFVTVEQGHKGVVIFFGKVQEEVLGEGFHIINPLANVKQLSARIEKDEEICNCETSDTQSVSIKIITNWRPDGIKMAALYKDYGENYAQKILPPAVKESVKAEIAKYKVIDIVEKRSTIHANAQETINKWLNKYGLELLEIGITDIDFSDKYDKAIEEKQLQEQQSLQKKYELDKTVTEAQMAEAKAKGEADSQVAAARGAAESVKLAAQAEADALKIRGEAQAEYNKRVAESLSPLLIQLDYLKKWDGRLPVYTLGGNASPMIMIPNTSEK